MTNPTPTTTTIADDVRNFITRFIALPDEHYADALALYIIGTYTLDSFKVTPYLYINSSEPGSGKTLTLEILESLCRNATMAANLSSSSLFRIIQARRPTVLIDEVDAVWSGAKNEELRGVINSGYKSTGKVWRAVGDPNDEDGGVKEFSTFCPKVLAGIDNGMIPDTIMDRSIVITLKRATHEQMGELDEFYPEDLEDEIAVLVSRLHAWHSDHMDKLSDPDHRPARLDGLSPRANEIARPLLTIGALLGSGWYDRAKTSLRYLLDRRAPLAQNHAALLQVRDWFIRNPDQTAIPSAIITELTGENGKQIGWWFKDMGITPNYIRTGEGDERKNARGYKRSAFEAAFNRFLPAIEEAS